VVQLDVLTPAEAAAQLHASVDTVRALYHRGELDGFHMGRSIRIHAASLLAYANRHRNRGPEQLAHEPSRPRGRGKRAAGGTYRFLTHMNQ
jgi:excisionase family DNA binding protein